MVTNVSSETFSYVPLISGTVEIIQPDWTKSTTTFSVVQNTQDVPETQQSTQNPCIDDVEVIVANRSPLSIVVELDTSGCIVGAANKSEGQVFVSSTVV